MILLLSLWLTSASVFCLVVGDFTWQNVVLGLVLAGVLIRIFREQVLPKPLPPDGLSFHIILYIPVLMYYLFIDILKGTWQVMRVTLGLEPLRRPGIIKYPIPTKSQYGIGPVGYFITLSPGSFLVDVDLEENVLLVHVLDASNPEALRRDADKYYRLWEWVPNEDPDPERKAIDTLEDDDE